MDTTPICPGWLAIQPNDRAAPAIISITTAKVAMHG